MVQGINTRPQTATSTIKVNETLKKVKETEEKSFKEQSDAFKVSFNKKILETFTYDYTAKISSNEQTDDSIDNFNSVVADLIKRQGMTVEDALNGKVEVDDEARTEASELISDNGYWGVDQTSTRIFEFTIGAAGDDTEKLEQIKAGIEKGFGMALDSFGGSLPEISYKTHNAVIDKLDEWAGVYSDEETEIG